jgi:hypothetical protein
MTQPIHRIMDYVCSVIMISRDTTWDVFTQVMPANMGYGHTRRSYIGEVRALCVQIRGERGRTDPKTSARDGSQVGEEQRVLNEQLDG